MIEREIDARPELVAALAALGLTPHRIVVISPIEERREARCAYRVEVVGGRVVKARRLESAELAQQQLELRVGLDAAFSAAVSRHGSVLIEEWVDGEPLTESDSESRAEEAGALLGRLHTSKVLPRANAPTEQWTTEALGDLALLQRSAKLTTNDAAQIESNLRLLDPRVTVLALIHRDYCGENMLIDRSGRLRVIDNEWLAVGPPDFDLARTVDRWPLSEAARLRFSRGYRSTADRDAEAQAFWAIVVSLSTARVRLNRTPARLESALETLRRLARGAEP